MFHDILSIRHLNLEGGHGSRKFEDHWDRQSQPNGRGCRLWELQNLPFAFCERFGTVSSNFSTGPSKCTYRFSAACIQAGTKISPEKSDALCLSRRPKQFIQQVSGNTLQQVKFKYLSPLRCYSRVTEIGTKGLYSDSESKRSSTWALLLRDENGSFQRSQIFQFLNRSFFRSSPVVMNLE